MQRPRALNILMWFCAIYAIGAFFGMVAVITDLGRFLGGYSIGGMAVSREKWLTTAAPLIAIVAIFMGVTAIGLKGNRYWPRAVFICIWPIIIVYGIGSALLHAVPATLGLRAVIDASCVGAIAVWLLFVYKPSRSYFETVGKHS
jgi:hypothetical protein